ncbi:hypothetical protein HYW21_08270 [Candidatus Woesearchaeota archaeon]|nr:hypothetical protein [Candidatus Woesearchaeota archaeon]
MEKNKNNLEAKEGLFTTFCLGVGAVAAAPKAGQNIRRCFDLMSAQNRIQRKVIRKNL